MKWYQSATGSITIQNNNDEDITIPLGTMVCTDDSSVVYTINESGDVNIPANSYKTLNVIQGQLKTFNINGNPIITINNMVDNKLPLEDINIAENGIYVYNATNSLGIDSQWVKSNNIYAENWSSANTDFVYADKNFGRYFEFCIDPITQMPYILFVDDLAEKIDNGIIVKYIVTDGSNGNVSAGKLNKFYAAGIDTNNLIVTNLNAINNGYDPEDIETGRKKYFKNIDICSTLVTLRDYVNTIYLGNGLVSNCFVCDKTNDIQYCYKIKSNNGNNYYQEQRESPELDLTSYSLKFYGLHYSDIENGVDESMDYNTQGSIRWINYNHSFDLIQPMTSTEFPTSIPAEIEDYISDIKHISHDFVNIRNDLKLCMLQDVYDLKISLLFKQDISDDQKQLIKTNLTTNILHELNARQVNFGQKITYEDIQKIIYDTDERILGASISGLDDIDFKTYGIYWSKYVNIPIVTSNPTSIFGESYNPYADQNINAVAEYIEESSNGGKYKLYKFTTKWGEGEECELQNCEDFLQAESNPLTSQQCRIKDSYESWGELYTPNTSIPEAGSYIIVAQPQYIPSLAKDMPDDNIYIVELTKVESKPSVIDKEISISYPSKPIKVTNTDFEKVAQGVADCYFKINNYYYSCKYSKVNDRFVKYKYGYQYLCYIEDNLSTPIGSFHSILLNSEIDTNGDYDNNCELHKDTLKGKLQRDIYAKTVLAGKSSLYTRSESFTPSIRDINNVLSSNINYIMPNVDMHLYSQYTLKDNEYIQILNPEFDTIATYSYYVYVGYYNGASVDEKKTILSISAESNYRLRDGEYIIIYYRSSDEDNYQYSIYSGTDVIISCSKPITLYSLPINGTIASLHQLNKDTQYLSSQGTLNDYQQSQILKATTDTYARNRLTSLKSQDSLSVKKINPKLIEHYSFITNTAKNGKYVINFKSNNGKKNFYVLEEGESLSLYKTKGKTTPDYIFGAGSIIYIDNSKSELYSDGRSINDADVNMEGLSCEILQIAPGYQVNPVFGASFTSADGSNQFTKVDKSDVEEAYMVEINAVDINNTFDDDGNCKGNQDPSAATIDSAQIYSRMISSLERGSYSTVTSPHNFYVRFNNNKKENNKIKTTESINYRILLNISSQNVLHLNNEFQIYTNAAKIQYKSSSDSNFIEVNISDGGEYHTYIRSILRLDTSSDQQSLNYRFRDDFKNDIIQYILGFENVDSSNLALKIPDNITLDENNHYKYDKDKFESSNKLIDIMTSETISVLGRKLKLNNPTQFYAAEQFSEDDFISYDINKQNRLDYTNNITTVLVDIKDRKGNAFIPLPGAVWGDGFIIQFNINKSGNKRIAGLKVVSGQHLYSPSIPSDIYTLYNKQMQGPSNAYIIGDDLKSSYIIIYKASGTSEDGITIQVQTDNDDVDSTDIVIINKLTPFAINNELFIDGSDDAYNKISMRMGELDKNYEFQFDNSDMTKIRNPIAAASFLNNEHPYNQFTICRLSDLRYT